MCVAAAAAKLLQLCPTLCDPIDGSPPGSSIHEIFQARVLEWGAIAYYFNIELLFSHGIKCIENVKIGKLYFPDSF